MQDRLKFRVYFKGSEYAEAGYVDLTRSDVIFSLRADGQIIRNVVYDCKQEGHEGQPCNMPFTPNNNLYDIQFCTGLKDKNGKLIYDKDIVRDIPTQTVYKVSHKKCAFYLENKEYVGYFHELRQCFSISRLEIIGNVYENSELLNEVENDT